MKVASVAAVLLSSVLSESLSYLMFVFFFLGIQATERGLPVFCSNRDGGVVDEDDESPSLDLGGRIGPISFIPSVL